MKNCMHSSSLFIFSLMTSTSFIFVSSQVLANGSPCTTPNGEKAKCIPVNSCKVIRREINYFNEDAIKFARDSQCGYDDGPLVCCGSVGFKTTTPPPGLKTTTARPFNSLDVPPAKPIHHSLLPDDTLCGIHSEGRKGPGRIAEMAEFPWTVALYYSNGINGFFGCSGILISSKYVLTAAACLSMPGSELKFARLGEWKFSENIEKDENGKDVVLDMPIVKTFFHPYYNNKSGNNDIALLRLGGKVQFSESVRPICLPPLDFPPPPPGAIMEASGWHLTQNGVKSDIKMKARITMVSHGECEKKFPGYGRRYPNRVCARSIEPLCNGEAGIPLVTLYTKPDNTAEKLEDQWYLEGIIPKGFGCVGKENHGKSNDPSLYLRVSRYVGWILNHLRS